MFNVGSGEVLVILLVALIVLGPAQLPKAARQVGQVMNEIRKVSTGFQRELTSALEMEEQRATEKPTSPGGPRDLTPPPVDPDEHDDPADLDGLDDEAAIDESPSPAADDA